MRNNGDVCPITFAEPVCGVVASDRTVYDFCALAESLIVYGGLSPVTRGPISSIILLPLTHDIDDATAKNIAEWYYKLRLLLPDIQIHGVYELSAVKKQFDSYDTTSLYKAVNTMPNALRPGETLFFIAAVQGNIAVMAALRDLGMDINHQHFANQVTALHYAAEVGNVGLVAWLISNENCDVNVRRDNGGTPIDTAVLYNQHEVVDFLVRDPRVDLNSVRNDRQTTALDVATRRKHHQCMYVLLSNPNTFIGRALEHAKKNQDAVALGIILDCYLSRMFYCPERVTLEFTQWPRLSIDLLLDYREMLWEKITLVEGFELLEEYYDHETQTNEQGQQQQIKKLNRPKYAALLHTIFFEEGSQHPLKKVILTEPEMSSLVVHTVFGKTSSPASITHQSPPQAANSIAGWIEKIERFITLLHNDVPFIRLDFS